MLVPMEIAGRRDALARGRALLDEVGLADRGHHYPSQLSGGEQQRVAIARALANDPPIVLADEPTGNLDAATGRHVIELLLAINRARGTTLIIVTHDPEIAAMADARIVLRAGCAVEREDSSRHEVRAPHRVRETRFAWKRLVFFFVCIAIGVAAIVSHPLGDPERPARPVERGSDLIAADVLVSTDRPWPADAHDRVARAAAAAGGRAIESIEMPTMARPADETADVTKVVELRAVQAGFPFYGDLTLQDGRPYAHQLLEGHGALVRPELLPQLNIALGDRICDRQGHVHGARRRSPRSQDAR